MSTETKPAASYSPGLEGIIAGESTLCWVDPNAGLLYRGYDVHDLAAHASYEEVVWLLLHGELPTMTEFGQLSRALSEQRSLPPPVLSMLELFPATTHPMDVLRTGVSMLAAFDPDLNEHSHEASLRKAVRLIAKTSSLITAGWRIVHGQEPLAAKPDLTHAANF